MDMKVSTYHGDPKQSLYKVGRSNANVTHREMLGRLFSEMKMEMDQATDHLAMIHGTHGQATREAEETEETLAKEPPAPPARIRPTPQRPLPDKGRCEQPLHRPFSCLRLAPKSCCIFAH